MDDVALQQIAVNLGPWAFVAYLVFQLLTKALDRLNRQSRQNGRTGDHDDAGTAESETETDLSA